MVSVVYGKKTHYSLLGIRQQLRYGGANATGLHSNFTKDSLSSVDIMATSVLHDAREVPLSG